MKEDYEYSIRIRINPDTKISKYIDKVRDKYTTLSKIITDALESYIDIINGDIAVDKQGIIHGEEELLDIKEVKELMKDIKRVNRRLESYIFDRIVGVEKKGAE